ncbi:MAG: sigma-70 family RNA polymerase sigma factor [Acidobacteriota bacterium]
MEFRTFDEAYVQKLTDGDPATEAHFHTYFSQFLSLKLRSRRMDADSAADIRQETLYRVLKVLRSGNGVAHPERFGAFVNSVCRNVLLEAGRREARNPDLGEDPPEVADRAMDLERSLITSERKRIVKKILDELPDRDREILRMVFFEEADRETICARLNVEPGHLRVLLHRAKARFQAAGARGGRLVSQILLFLCNGSGAIVTTG